MVETAHPLVTYRERHGLSQAALGQKLDPPVTDMTVWRWENRIAIPRPPYLQQIEKLAGIRMDVMIRACSSDHPPTEAAE